MHPTPDKRRALTIARRIIGEPTAPFHEHKVRAALVELLDRAKVPWRLDRFGNLLASYKRGAGYPLALVAHMDHPGLEVYSVVGREAEALWYGQVPPFDLRGLKVALWSPGSGGRRRGTAVVVDGDGRRPLPRARTIKLRVPPGSETGDFGHAELPPFKLSAGAITSKALDNPGSCAVAAACLDHLARHKVPADIQVLFTRAEEGGFFGAAAAIKAGTLARRRPVIVLECSKAIPGAEMGKGPVIRIGDKTGVFDRDLDAACRAAAAALQAERKGLSVQRRLMDGGRCEATLFSLEGYTTMGLALPLGNYHNIGPRGVAAERISLRDFLGEIDLACAFASVGLAPRRALKALKSQLRKRFTRTLEEKLRRSAAL